MNSKTNIPLNMHKHEVILLKILTSSTIHISCMCLATNVLSYAAFRGSDLILIPYHMLCCQVLFTLPYLFLKLVLLSYE